RRATILPLCLQGHASRHVNAMTRVQAMKCIACIVGSLAFVVSVAFADDSERVLTIDHYVRVTSTVPAIAGQPAQLYVRERALAGGALRAASFNDRVVLFVHGAGTPSEVAFDVPYQDYSWMAFLAR